MDDGTNDEVLGTSSAHSSAEERELGRWPARPNVVRLIRFLVVAVPIAMSVLALRVTTALIPRPNGITGTVVWFALAVAVAFATLRAVDRVARRFLPLAALFKFSLVFPDQAPARFGVALRTGTTRQLEKRLADLRERPDEVDLITGAETLLSLVARISDHDRLTRGHSERVRAFSDLIAEQMKLADADREKLHWAALLHDVGKLQISSDVLAKPGKLNDDEWAEIRTHPSLGGELLKPLEPWLGEWVRASSEHHERWDGGGYPKGLRGDEIALAGRIVAVADAYDVMTAARSYKEASSPDKARSELAANAGTQFDPEVVRAFLNVGVGRVKSVAGSMAWFSQFPGLAQTASTVASTSGGAATATALTALGLTAGVGVIAPSTTPTITVAVTAAPAEDTPDEVPITTTTTVIVQLATSDNTPAVDPVQTTSTTTSTSTTTTTEVPVVPATTAAKVSATTSPVVIATTVPIPTTSTSPVTTTSPVATTTKPPATTTTTVPVTTTTTKVVGEILSADSVGGQAVLSFTSTLVEVVSVTPAEGYTATVTRISPTHVSIRFVNGKLSNRIRARWKDGAPEIEYL